MFQWFQDCQENYVVDYLEDHISDFLLNEFHDEEMLRKKLYMLDEKITKQDYKRRPAMVDELRKAGF